MKQYLLTVLLGLIGLSMAHGQTTATDFTATDCNGATHTLFHDLDSGKVAVLVWVMPCGLCISDAKAAFDVASGFATSHPGKVVYYLIDDIGDASCSTLNSWASTNNMSGAVTFSNAGNAINQANYGGSGMPHVVVVAPNRRIYLNLLSGSNDLLAINDAVSAAFASTGVGTTNNGKTSLAVYPNPAKENITANCVLTKSGVVNIDIFDARGMNVQSLSEVKNAGEQTLTIPLSSKLSSGYYLLRVSASGVPLATGFNLTR